MRVSFVLAVVDLVCAAHNDDAATSRLQAPQFGHVLRAKWYFTDNFTDMNHGFGGMTPRVVHEAQQRASGRRRVLLYRATLSSSETAVDVDQVMSYDVNPTQHCGGGDAPLARMSRLHVKR